MVLFVFMTCVPSRQVFQRNMFDQVPLSNGVRARKKRGGVSHEEFDDGHVRLTVWMRWNFI